MFKAIPAELHSDNCMYRQAVGWRFAVLIVMGTTKNHEKYLT